MNGGSDERQHTRSERGKLSFAQQVDPMRLRTITDMNRYFRSHTARQKLANLFQDVTIERWWLPNDEGFTPILQSVRAFADERNAVALTVQQESMREVSQVFVKLGKMGISDESSSTAS